MSIQGPCPAADIPLRRLRAHLRRQVPGPMTLLKATLCLTLIFAAAVLYPLRRAQQGFSPRVGTPAVAATGRPKPRGRPGRGILAAPSPGGIEGPGAAGPPRGG